MNRDGAGQAGNGEWICRALRSLQGLWLVLCVKWRVTAESEKNDMTGFPFQKDHLGSFIENELRKTEEQGYKQKYYYFLV